jgi:holo-[acyl-carrier protein] synthase
MTILGIGMDIVAMEAFEAQLSDAASVFVAQTFTAQERADAAKGTARAEAWSLAARFAAKEAFIKAWGGARYGAPPSLTRVDYRDMEVARDAFGRPQLVLHGEVARAVAPLGGLRIHLSLSHDGPVAAAYVILEANA